MRDNQVEDYRRTERIVAARSREEVLNVELARLLVRRGLVSAPETIERNGDRQRLPDVVVNFRGLRVLLEGKTADAADARSVVSRQAQERVDEGLAHIAIAVVYPSVLRGVAFADLGEALSRSALDAQIHSEGGTTGWVHVSDVDELVELLVRTYEQLVNEDVVAEAVAIVEAGIDLFAREVRAIPAGGQRIAAVLEVGEPDSGELGGGDDSES